MPIAFLLAAVLAQAAPVAPPPSVEDAAAASNLPKDDYGLVAWCHGALAGQLELDPIAHADMISIEGKAKVAARAKSDAEMEKDRREYLHEYERALAAAEKASPTAIHQYGVDSEVSGYKLWGATREKQPIWRMLDWGMWDPNDAGCGDAAKRLYNKATLFGAALKGPSDDKAPAAGSETSTPLLPAFTAHGDGAPIADSAVANSAPTTGAASDAAAPAPETTAPPPTDLTAATAAAPDASTPPTVSTAKSVKAKPTKGRTTRLPKAKAAAAAEATSPPAASPAPAPDPDPAAPATDQAAPPATSLRGPQS